MAKSKVLRPDALPEFKVYASDADSPWGDETLFMWVIAEPLEVVAEIRRLREEIRQLRDEQHTRDYARSMQNE